MSEIVSKYYTLAEKLGLKKHEVGSDETAFLESFPELEQLKLLDDEDLFNIRRISLKYQVSRKLSIISAIAGLVLIVSNWLLSIAVFVFALLLFIISKHLHGRLIILAGSRGIMYGAREHEMEKMFK